MKSICQLIVLVLLLAPAFANPRYNVGDIVEVQPSMLADPSRATSWVQAKILEVGPNIIRVEAEGTTYVIRTDNGGIWVRSPELPGPNGARPAQQQPQGVGGLQIGQRVEVQPSMMQNPAAALWETATLTEVLSPRVVRVRTDDGTTYDIITDQPQKWIRAPLGQAQARPNATAAPQPVPTQLTATAPGYQVGQRVEVQPTMLNNPGAGGTWVAGTIKEIMGTNAVRVIADDGYTYDILTTGQKWIRPASPVAANGPAATPPQGHGGNANPPAKMPGLGAPPDGVYTCLIVTGGVTVGSGNLVIRGGSYSGLVPGSPFAPYTVAAGGELRLSAGLVGMPNGFLLRSVRYTGPDNQGHPMIQIDYTSPGGWNETMDAVLE